MLYALLVAVLVGADQITKFLVRTHVPLYGSRPLIPHLVQLTYVRNTGAAFSLFAKHTWILAVLSAVVSVAIIIVLAKGIVDTSAGRLCLSVLLAGTIGNFIDRAFIGYVTDMFDLLFMSFAVFNIADICIVCGGIATCIYLLFFYTKWEKE